LIEDSNVSGLGYASRRAAGLTDDEAGDCIVLPAMTQNRQRDITGRLCFDGQRFFQVLKGPKSALSVLDEVIARDQRHADVVIFARAAESRWFPQQRELKCGGSAGLDPLDERLWGRDTMPRKAVFTDVMDVLERRIVAGEFMLRDLPGERKIADEVGVSYMTARKAVLGLIDKGVLARRANGSLKVHPEFLGDAGRCQVALLAPAFASTHLARCRMAVAEATKDRDIQLRAVEFVHWDDAAVRDAVENSDGCVVIPTTEPIPERVFRRFTAEHTKVVFLDADLTSHGIPSIRLVSKEHIAEIFEHLWSLGHRRIDCLNTQGRNDEIESRIEQWKTFIDRRGGTGELFDDPAPPFTDPMERARALMHRVLDERRGTLSAIVCTTAPAALAAVRGCHDRGVRVGEELSVCAINNEPTGRYYVPSLTGLEMPDIGPMLEPCFAWFAEENDEPWPHDYLITPAASTLFRGESTGPAPISPTTAQHVDQ